MILSAFEGGDTRSLREVYTCRVFPAKGLPHLAAPCGPVIPPGPPRTCRTPHQGIGPTNSSIPLRQLGSRDPGTLALGQMDTHPVLCQLLHLLPNACDGKPPGSRLALTQPFPFGGNSMIGNGHHLCFQENQFFQANKSNEMGVLQPSPAIVMVGLPIQKECSEMGRGLFEM